MGEPRVARWALALTALAVLGHGADAVGRESYGTLYRLGKDAYLEEDYRSCVNLLLQALQDQREFQQLLVDCRGRCRQQSAGEALLLAAEPEPEPRVFERLIRETRCLVQCHKERLGARIQHYYDSAWADDEFRERKPYEYLQLCYYKTGEVQKAANAVFTVLLSSPNNEVMRENFKYYTTMEGVDNANIVSLERQEHNELYVRANDAYESGRWEQVTRLMEDALEGFLEAEQRCRTLCERFFPQGFNPDFVANVANHFAYVLRCKIRCPEQLSTVAGNYLSDYLESHFHYLQFAYYKQNQLREACSNVANYLLFRPEDQDMLGNKRLYLKDEEVDESLFVPRPDIVEIFKRRESEKKLDNYILENFRFSDGEVKKGEDSLPLSSFGVQPTPDGKASQDFKLAQNRDSQPTQDRETGSGSQPNQDRESGSSSQPTQDRESGSGSQPNQDRESGSSSQPTQDRESGSSSQPTQDRETGSSSQPTQDRETGSSSQPTRDRRTGPELQTTVDRERGPDHVTSADSEARSDGKTKPDSETSSYSKTSSSRDTNWDLETILHWKTSASRETILDGRTSTSRETSPDEKARPPRETSPASKVSLYDRPSQGGPAQPTGATLVDLHSRVMAGALSRPPGPWLERALVTGGPTELGGPQRFLADGMVTSRECQQLIGLLQAAGATGDGYHKRVPLTPFEEFRGLSFGRLLLKVDRGEVSPASLRLLMDVADSARLFTARQFGLSQLYSSYTHLVGRTFIPDMGRNRSTSDLSHAIHVDNCLLSTNGTCSQGKGAYIHRHYSAILYLNDDFKGGEFVFADIVKRRPTVRVKPRCGRLVGFSAGTENPHGVLAVTGGTRYTLAMWYTKTAEQREDEKMVADLYLHDKGMPGIGGIISVLEKSFEMADNMLRN